MLCTLKFVVHSPNNEHLVVSHFFSNVNNAEMDIYALIFV